MPESITINGIEFSHKDGVNYAHDYVSIAKDIGKGELDEINTYRTLIRNDLWFIVYFVMGIKTANHSFVVDACQEVEQGPDDFTLDIWAREHFKSSILTIAETIQYCLKDPEKSTCIFSYARPVAKKFLFEIKSVLQGSNFLKACFPDVLWENPEREAPIWSLDDGLILKRNTNRKEPNVMASGLVEGMPTGMHFNRMVFDDIVTEDMAQSIDVLEKVKQKFDSAQNLGTDGGTHRVIGTFYHHNDPLIYIRDKKDEDDNPVYLQRLKPATDDGSHDGKPVLLSQERLNKLKLTKTFNCQQLLDPTPRGIRRLPSEMLQEIEPNFIPDDLYRFMTIDAAGDDKDGKGDAWAFHLIGVNPHMDEIGASNIYILDSVISPLRDTEAIEQIVRMYLSGGFIHQLGVEKVGLSTTEIHVANALQTKGRYVSQDSGTLVILRPAGRNKIQRIENALAWPLYNGKMFISTDVPFAYRERLRMEMDKFPFWHDDGLDALSYVYDMIKDCRFLTYQKGPRKKERYASDKYSMEIKDISRAGWRGNE